MHHDIDITLAGLPAETPTWLRAEISHSLALLNALDELEQIADSAAFQRWFHTRLLPLFPCQYAIVGVITLENGQPRVDAPLLQQLPLHRCRCRLAPASLSVCQPQWGKAGNLPMC